MLQASYIYRKNWAISTFQMNESKWLTFCSSAALPPTSDLAESQQKNYIFFIDAG